MNGFLSSVTQDGDTSLGSLLAWKTTPVKRIHMQILKKRQRKERGQSQESRSVDPI